MYSYTAIGFICGFICREVILRQQLYRARQILKTLQRMSEER